MAVGIRQSAKNSSGGTSSSAILVNAPTGLAANDVMVVNIGISSNSSPTITAPTGWTQRVAQIQGTTLRQFVYWKVAGSSEPSSYTWTYSVNSPWSIENVAYTGVNVSSPVADSTVFTGGSTLNPAYTATGAETGQVYAVLCGAVRNTSTMISVSSPSSGWTTEQDGSNTVNPFTESFIQDQHTEYSSPASIAPGTSTMSAAGTYCTAVIVLNVDFVPATVTPTYMPYRPPFLT